ncbi:hypothetical protein WH47_09771, partial [Habropoda laboriosa]
LTALWTPFTLLITSRHARRFVYVRFPAKLPTDHNYSANNNRPSERFRARSAWRATILWIYVPKRNVDPTIYGNEDRSRGVNTNGEGLVGGTCDIEGTRFSRVPDSLDRCSRVVFENYRRGDFSSSLSGGRIEQVGESSRRIYGDSWELSRGWFL